MWPPCHAVYIKFVAYLVVAQCRAQNSTIFSRPVFRFLLSLSLYLCSMSLSITMNNNSNYGISIGDTSQYIIVYAIKFNAFTGLFQCGVILIECFNTTSIAPTAPTTGKNIIAACIHNFVLLRCRCCYFLNHFSLAS